jgi:tetratricopeptide (TPR) repeat protein
MSGGSAGGGGYEFQARIIAFVAVHIVAQRPLTFIRLPIKAVPVAVSAETGGAGDDLRVEILDGPVFEIQAKKGLQRGPDFDQTIDRFAAILPVHPTQHGILAVDPAASGTIHELARDLDRLRSGRADGLSAAAEDVRARVHASGDAAVISRIHILVLDLLADTSPLRLVAVQMLRGVLEDADGAEAAWDAIVAESLRLVRERGRHDTSSLTAFLVSRQLPLAGAAISVRTEVHATYLAVQRIEEQLSTGSPPAPTPSLVDSRWTARLDLARDLINGLRPRSALASLRTTEDDLLRSDAGGIVRARFYNLLGVALLRTGETAEAREALQQALNHDPENGVALLNFAAAAHVDGDDSVATDLARRVLEKDPTSSGAWSILVHSAAALGDTVFVPSDLEAEPDVAVALASLAMRARRWSDAVALLEGSLATKGRRDPQRLVLLAEALWAWVESEDDFADHELLLRAERLSTEGIDLLREAEDPQELARALVLRASICRSTGQIDQAFTDIAAALDADPTYWRAALMGSILDLERGEPERVLQRFERFADANVPPPIHVMRARALAALGRPGDAVLQNLRAATSAARGENDIMETRFAVAEVAIGAELLAFAEEVLSGVPQEKRSWYWLLMMGRISVRRGSIDTATTMYLEAIDRAGERERNIARVEFGSVLAKHEQLDAAIEQFELAAADEGDEHARERFARALYSKGELTRAFAILAAAERDGIASLWVAELGALIAHKRNDPATEQQYLERVLAMEPTDAETSIRLGAALLRQGKFAQLSPLLAGLRIRTDLPGWQLVQAAELHLEAGEPEHALPMAFRAVRSEPDDPGVQLAFVNIFLHRADEERTLDPEVVGPDTYLVLEGPRAEKLSYLLLSEGPTDIRRDEFLYSDPRVSRLAGKRVGDFVILRAGALSEATYRVAEIKHAMVQVFQDTMIHFGQRNPENTALQQFRVGPEPTADDFAFLFDSLTEARTRGETVRGMYREQGLPLGLVSVLLGRKLPDVYAAFSGLYGETLYVEFPEQAALREAVGLVATAKDAVLTRSALVTMGELDLFGSVSTRFENLLVPQSLLDELDEEARDLRLSLSDGRKSAVAVEGGFTMYEESAEDTRLHYAARRNLITWVRKHARVVPLPFEATGPDVEQWRERLGESTMDSYMLAIHEGIPIYADDLGLRRLAIGPDERRAPGFSTVAVLISAAERGEILPREFHRQTAHLVRLNHGHVPISADTLFTALVDATFELDSGTLRLFDRLRGKYSNHTSAAGVAAELLQKVTLSPRETTLTAVTNICLECLTDGHPLPDSIRLFAHAYRRRLALLPNARRAVDAALTAFLNRRMLEGGSDPPAAP